MPANNDAIVTVTEERIGHTVRKKRVNWTADTGDGSVPSTGCGLRGWVFMAVTNPDGTKVPDDNYDIVLNDGNGFDVMGGTLANRSNTTTQQAFPILVGTTYGERFVDGGLTFVLSGNTDVSAAGICDIYYKAE